MTDDHLDLDALAEATAEEPDGRSTVARHLAGCAGCTARLAELRAAEPSVRTALASLPVPPLPDDIAQRLDAVLAELGAGPASEPVAEVTTLPRPTSTSTRGRWLAAAAGLAVVLAGIGAGLSTLRDPDDRPTVASDAGGLAGPVRNDTGTDYADRDALAAAVPDLLRGTAPASAELRAAAPQAASPASPAPEAAPLSGAADAPAAGSGGTTSGTGGGAPAVAGGADPLTRLRTEAGLTDCLRALLPPDDPSVQPLALDYGRFRGVPALVVVLPGVAADKLDVYVVGSGCSPANDSTLFYASVPAP